MFSFMFSFTSCGWLGACASLTWGVHGTRMHYGNKASWRRQCLGNVLLGNLGSCHPCGCYFDPYHLPKRCYRPCLPPFMETVFPDGCGLFQQDNAPCHKAKMLQEWFDEHNNEFEVLTWPPNSPDLNPIEHLWDVLNKQRQIPQHTFRDLVESMPRWVRAVLAAK
ncbi:hypothetical protein QTP70_020917, partial [Hemibagrus guttatus]